uniref:IL4R n=1 Tax=Steinernema glaseri TaxID=37863 RepID=A0A1I7XZ27_9BILA
MQQSALPHIIVFFTVLLVVSAHSYMPTAWPTFKHLSPFYSFSAEILTNFRENVSQEAEVLSQHCHKGTELWEWRVSNFSALAEKMFDPDHCLF